MYVMNSNHEILNPLKCYQCNKTFVNKDKLEEHNQEEHN